MVAHEIGECARKIFHSNDLPRPSSKASEPFRDSNA
jgi:hypothetical protein